jgi:hypothetical protein
MAAAIVHSLTTDASPKPGRSARIILNDGACPLIVVAVSSHIVLVSGKAWIKTSECLLWGAE